MKVAILGTRGIPANYGGFETFAEELGTRLVKKGFDVSIYCRRDTGKSHDEFYKGVRLVVLPTIKHKYFDTIAHTFVSALHVSFTGTDIVYFCNAINSIFMIFPRLFGKKVVMNVDGLEWKRAKWNRLGKWAYRVSERIATIFAHEIVSDSRGIQAYYKEKFNAETNFITYGARRVAVSRSGSFLKKFGLKKRKYILYVSRLEPENNAHVVINAYERVKTDMPLVIVGDAPYGKPYIKQLRSTKDARIKFLGSIYGEGYRALQSNAFCYIHGNEVGGTNPALLEAMAYGNCVIVNGVPFNREVVGDCGLWFKPGDPSDLKIKIERLFKKPLEVGRFRKMAPERIKKHYNWDDIVEKYIVFFRSIKK